MGLDIYFHHTNIHVIATTDEFIINHVFHQMGTLLLAVLPGAMMRLTDPLVARLKGRSGKGD